MFNTLPMSQRDPAWKRNQLGFDATTTIGSDGCLLICLTMLANGSGERETPASLNQKFIALGEGRGYSGALFVWAGMQRVFANLELRALRITRGSPASMPEIDAALGLGDPVIVELDHSPQSGFDNHWVMIYDKRGSDYLIHDPWPVLAETADVSLQARFGFAGDASRIITGAAFFHNTGLPEPAGDPLPVQVINNDDVRAAGGLALRSMPNGELIRREPPLTMLMALEPLALVRTRLGQQGEWLHVRAADGMLGYMAAWMLQAAQAPAPSDDSITLRINNDPDIVLAGGLALRATPGGALVRRLPVGTLVKAQCTRSEALAALGAPDQWLRVQLADGTIGYVAAWLISLVDAMRALPGEPARDIGDPAENAVQLPIRKPRVQLIATVRDDATHTPNRGKGGGASTPQKRRHAKLRKSPRIGAILLELKPRSKLIVLESAKAAYAKVGRRGKWIKMQAQRGVVGYASAVHVRLPALPPSAHKPRRLARGLGLVAAFVEPDQRPSVRVINNEDVASVGGLSLRDAPSTTGALLARLPPGGGAHSRLSANDTAPLLGVENRWLPVVTPAGKAGFCAAWYLERGTSGWGSLPTPAADDPSGGTVTDPAIVTQRVVIANTDARLRAAGVQDAPTAWQVTAGTPLRVNEDGADWVAKVGDANKWVRVETYAFKQGFVRGSQLRLPAHADARAKVEDRPLPIGVSAWLYGIHDPFDRGLFGSGNKGGWVLFTERVQSRAGNTAYADWADAGYGVIGRLNNDYGGSGTVPTPDKYEEFANQCADWVRNSRGCLVWVIGNEMNNPREWPNWHDGLDWCSHPEQITPEQYAGCFNRVRRAIKQVNPKAIVVPGAVDCFQGPCMSSLEYWTRMLARIDDLDGLALHCYTNGYTPDLVTSLGTFGNDPLTWQYYNFRAYSTYLDVVPEKWRIKPLFVTETDAHGSDPWHEDGNGWVQAAYAELNRWNNQPHAQQILAAILYRWSTDDIYTLQRRPGVQGDIRSTITSTDYRWRA